MATACRPLFTWELWGRLLSGCTVEEGMWGFLGTAPKSQAPLSLRVYLIYPPPPSIPFFHSLYSHLVNCPVNGKNNNCCVISLCAMGVILSMDCAWCVQVLNDVRAHEGRSSCRAWLCSRTLQWLQCTDTKLMSHILLAAGIALGELWWRSDLLASPGVTHWIITRSIHCQAGEPNQGCQDPGLLYYSIIAQ